MKAWLVKAGSSSSSSCSVSFPGDDGPHNEEAPGEDDRVKTGGELDGGVLLRVDVDE